MLSEYCGLPEGLMRQPSNQPLPSGPGVKDFEMVIVNTGGSTLPHEVCGAQEEKKALFKGVH